jgi:hypothetical protein
MRKPSPHVLKRDRLRIDEDNICKEFGTSGSDLRDVNYDGRTRFQDIVANRLNVNRAIREIVLPRLDAVELQFANIRTQLDRIERVLNSLARGENTIKEFRPFPDGEG